jgi:hypothetical protein
MTLLAVVFPRPGSQATVFGQGGLVDAGIGVVEDLQALSEGRGGLQNILGAVQKAGSLGKIQNKGGWTVCANQEGKRMAANQILQQSLPGAVRQVVNLGNGQIFPKAPPLNTGIGQRNTGQGVLGPNSRIGL